MLLVALVIVAVLALLPASAAADGLPAVGIDARPLSVPGGQVEYTTERVGRDTRLVESARYGGPLRARRLRGDYSVPAVAYDGSPSGLSADGRTLVLITPRAHFPRKSTTFAVLDARSLAVRRRITLKGDFSFDALSPDGRVMYLIQYLSPTDFTKYAVRAYDMRTRRFFVRPVVDPSEPGEDMSGLPVTRVSSRDGRWAYTLYGARKHPFVHALDTERRTAVCIDIDGAKSVWGGALALRGNRLEVVDERGGPVASIDTRTHEVIKKPAREPDASTSWLPIAVPTAVLLLLLAAATRRHVAAKRRSAGAQMPQGSLPSSRP
jgi:hypothetical protein